MSRFVESFVELFISKLITGVSAFEKTNYYQNFGSPKDHASLWGNWSANYATTRIPKDLISKELWKEWKEGVCWQIHTMWHEIFTSGSDDLYKMCEVMKEHLSKFVEETSQEEGHVMCAYRKAWEAKNPP